MSQKKNFEVTKTESFSTENSSSDLIYKEKLFLSWKRNLKKWSASKGDEWNVVSLDGGKYNIPQDAYNDFLNLYKDYLSNGCKLCIAEKQKPTGPLVVDLDYEYSIKPNDLMDITKEIAKKGRDLITSDYIIMTKSKEKETKRGKKYGVHIIYPLSVLNIDEKIVVFNELRNVLKRHEGKFIEKAKKILDESVISKNGWLLYGSMKKDDTEYYKIDSHSFTNLPNDLVSFLSVRNKSEKITISPEKIVNKEENNEKEMVTEKVCTNEKVEENDIIKLLSLLSSDRVNNYDDWLKVALICKYHDIDYYIFDKWSQTGNTYDKNNNMKIWVNINDLYKGIPLTIGSLHYMAKLDNPEEYKRYFNGLKTYEETKKDFEKTHFKVMSPLLYVTLDNNNMDIKKRQDFKNAYENLYYKVVNKKGEYEIKPFIEAWLRDTNIKTYNKIDFIPNCNCPSNIYNLFNEFKANKINQDIDNIDLTPMKNHIEKILCNDDIAGYTYFYKWLAQIVQQPDVLPGIAIVFISGQGSGKNTFFDWFGNKILGNEYYTTTSNIEYIMGRFAQGLRNKFLVNLDETKGKETFANSDRLKSLITAPIIQYEKKGFDPIDFNNYCRFIFTTNNSTPVKVENDDRRFVVFECSDDKKNNKEYFTKLYQWINNPINAKAFYNYLMTIDITTVDWVNDRPKTKIYEELRKVNIPLVARFLSDYYDSRNSDFANVSSNSLFSNFNTWMDTNKYHTEFNSTSFGRELNKYDGIEKVRKNSGNFYSIDFNKLYYYLKKKNYIEDLPEIKEISDDE